MSKVKVSFLRKGNTSETIIEIRLKPLYLLTFIFLYDKFNKQVVINTWVLDLLLLFSGLGSCNFFIILERTRKMKLSGAAILIEVLAEQGVDTVFGYPGGMVLNIYDELYKNSHRVKHIITSHEQGATHAADGYARVTGKAGVVIATSGPGATNLVTGIANAYLDSIPLVAITGNVATDFLGRDSFQEVDITGITMPITKHNYIVKDITMLADILREAFAVATSGRPGPVLVDIPKDIQQGMTNFVPATKKTVPTKIEIDESALKEAIELITSAKRPFIYAGGGVVSSDASKILLEFANKIDAPIGSSMMGLSAIPWNEPRALGMVGMHGRYAATRAITDCDLIIAVGVRFSDRATGNKNEFSIGHKVLHIDIDPAEISKNITAYTGLIGDVKQVLQILCKKLPQFTHKTWHAEVVRLKNHVDNNLQMAKNKLTPQVIIEKVNEKMPKDGIVATDVGQHQMWTAQYYKFSTPRTFITSGGLGTMGFGMGAAMGACIGKSNKRTVLFTSDGSFHMNMNELATAVANELPLIIVVLNNCVLGMVRQWQTLFFDKRYSNTSINRCTNFAGVADNFGARGFKVVSLKELDEVLEKAFKFKTPVLIDCKIDSDERVLPMIPANGSIKDIILR
jgi:acetolactate synthase-1/2/3 large subunit